MHETILAAIASFAIATIGTIALPTIEPNYEPELPPCEHEDSHGCYWDASTRGNGQGRSFDVDDDGIITYWDELD